MTRQRFVLGRQCDLNSRLHRGPISLPRLFFVPLMIVSLGKALDATYRAHTGPVHNRRRGRIFIRERQNFKLTRDRYFVVRLLP